MGTNSCAGHGKLDRSEWSPDARMGNSSTIAKGLLGVARRKWLRFSLMAARLIIVWGIGIWQRTVPATSKKLPVHPVHKMQKLVLLGRKGGKAKNHLYSCVFEGIVA